MSLHADRACISRAAALVLVVAFVFFAQGWIGGGDAKLAAATALWFGFDYLLDYLIYASLFGGALTLLLLQFRKLPLPARLAHQDWICACMRQAAACPTASRSRRRRSLSIRRPAGCRLRRLRQRSAPLPRARQY